MPNFKVSIIINNFNYDRFLEAALDSALNQTYAEVEVIVVDDGSTDKSREVLKNYTDRVLVLLQENAGQGAAFNAGFEKSSGDLILFLDSDDSLHTKAIAELISHWSESFIKLQFPLEIVDCEGNFTGLSMPSNRLSEGNVLPRLLKVGRYQTAPTSGNLYSRSFLKTALPMPTADWKQGADSYLNTLAGFAGTVGAVHCHLGYYRVHGESMTTVVFKEKINLSQIEKLIQHGKRQQALVNDIVRSKCLSADRDGLEKHWLQLKLTITYQKLALNGKPYDGDSLPKNVYRFVKSVILDHEVGFPRKLQLSCWAIFSAAFPKKYAERVLLYGFDFAPKSKLKQILRRSWNRDNADLVPLPRKGAS